MPARIPPQRAIAVLATLTVLLIALAVGVLLWQLRKAELASARVATANLAHMLQEHTERTFEAADQALRDVQERLQGDSANRGALDGAQARQLLATAMAAAPQLQAVSLADPQGRLLNASGTDGDPRHSLADPAAPAFGADAGDRLRLGRPRRSAAGDWTIELARPIRDAHGRLRGVVSGTLGIPRFEDFHHALQLDHPQLALYFADGTLLASLPRRDAMLGERPPELGAARLEADETQVRIVTHRADDGSSQVFALAKTRGFPLYVGVTCDDEQALAAWREGAAAILLGAALVCAFVGAAALVLTRELRREAALQRQLRDTRDRHQHTLDALMDAVVTVDARQRIILFNAAAQRLFGYPEQQALGMPLERLIPANLRGRHAHQARSFVAAGGERSAMGARGEVSAVRSDGTRFPVDCTLSRTVVEGAPQVTAVLRDVSERRKAERELREANAQLRALSASLQTVREQERARIASELHDELGQQLTGLKLELSWHAGRVREGRPPDPQELDAMRHQLDAAIASVRRLATELRPRILDDLGFGPAVTWQATEFSRRSGVATVVDLAAADLVDGDAVATGLFRIVQESLTNVARHAQARQVRIELVTEAGELVLRVEDDGCGLGARRPGDGGMGLLGMRERASALGGELKLASGSAGGTRVEVRLPLRREPVLEEEA